MDQPVTQNKTQANSLNSSTKDNLARILSVIGTSISILSLCWTVYVFTVQRLDRQTFLALRPIVKSEIRTKLILSNSVNNKNSTLILEWEFTNHGKEDREIEVSTSSCMLHAASLVNGQIVDNPPLVVDMHNQLSRGSIYVLGGGDTDKLIGSREVLPGFYFIRCSLPLRNSKNVLIERFRYKGDEIYSEEQYLYVPQQAS